MLRDKSHAVSGFERLCAAELTPESDLAGRGRGGKKHDPMAVQESFKDKDKDARAEPTGDAMEVDTSMSPRQAGARRPHSGLHTL
jgi:hypothetical protein